jgi:hypothetical protein
MTPALLTTITETRKQVEAALEPVPTHLMHPTPIRQQ